MSMAIPPSFREFQMLFEQDSKSLFPDIRARDKERARAREMPDRERNGRWRSNPQARLRSLSWAADAILADLHEKDNLRDAVIDTFPSADGRGLILIVNPTLEAVEDLIDFLREHPRIEKFALGARKLSDGERIRAVKLKVTQVEDETDAPDAEGEEAKEAEQAQIASLDYSDGASSSQTNLSMPFYRGGSVGPRTFG